MKWSMVLVGILFSAVVSADEASFISSLNKYECELSVKKPEIKNEKLIVYASSAANAVELMAKQRVFIRVIKPDPGGPESLRAQPHGRQHPHRIRCRTGTGPLAVR